MQNTKKEWAHVKDVESMRELRLSKLKIENKKYMNIKLHIYPQRLVDQQRKSLERIKSNTYETLKKIRQISKNDSPSSIRATKNQSSLHRLAP